VAPSASSPVDPLLIGAGAGALAVAGVLGAGLLARRRRSLIRFSSLPETDVALEGGFAQARLTPVVDRGGQRRGGVADEVHRLAASVLQFLRDSAGVDTAAGASIVSARHGRSSTTLALVAPIASQAHLVDRLPEIATRLGAGASAEAELTPDGDVAVRVRGFSAGLNSAPDVSAHVAVPTLVPIGVLPDRQEFLANWDSLGHVLIASPFGGGATAVLTSVLAHLAARRDPARLQIRMIAGSRALPQALLGLPHQVGPAIDPLDQEALAAVLYEVRAELDRRLVGGWADQPELVLVAAELLEVEPYSGLLGEVGERGPACGVRLLAASTRPGDELARNPLLGDFTTRLLQRTADEDESVALLGSADAAYLGGGGRLLFRSEHRMPIELYGYRVAPADLDRLVAAMRAPSKQARHDPAPCCSSADAAASRPGESADGATRGDSSEGAGREAHPELTGGLHSTTPDPVTDQVIDVTERAVSRATNGSYTPLPTEPEALLYVQCFAGPRVLRGDEEVWPSPSAGREQKPMQLLLFLAAHSTEGVDREKAVEALLAEDDSADPVATLRQWRRRVRGLLGRLVPDLPEDLFEDNGRSYRLNPRVVRSDVQRFLELERWAKTKGREDPKPAYEAMRALYVGDLFDRASAQPFAWAVAPGPGGASLVQEYRQIYQDAIRNLAERYAASADEPLLAERALELYEELVRLDPANERHWSALFRLHARLRDRVALERDWRRLCQVLQDEDRDAQPRGTTRDLYQQLLRSFDEPQRTGLPRAQEAHARDVA
jgi:DNA-binding SARP family transcriptional activator